MAIGTPGLLTLAHAHTSKAAAEATPIPAAADEIPVKPIAKPIATVDSGLIIINENDIAIKILIKIGCNVVNELIPCPISEVIIETYGSVKVPTQPTPVPTIIGRNTRLREPNLALIKRITIIARAAVNIVLITSPIPAKRKILVTFPSIVTSTNFQAPDPI